MSELIRVGALFAFVTLLLVSPATSQNGATPKVNPDAQVLSDFKKRVDEYVELHKAAAKDAPKLEETEDPAKIREAQLALAANIRAARKEARAGDIFTPDTRAKFRSLMYPELKGSEGRETKATIKEDAPSSTTVPVKVNATYPEGVPLSTVPPNLLAALPQLPEQLEYRVVGRHLILRDVEANIIVDFVPNAIR
jgi:hypothetical protein